MLGYGCWINCFRAPPSAISPGPACSTRNQAGRQLACHVAPAIRFISKYPGVFLCTFFGGCVRSRSADRAGLIHDHGVLFFIFVTSSPRARLSTNHSARCFCHIGATPALPGSAPGVLICFVGGRVGPTSFRCLRFWALQATLFITNNMRWRIGIG